MAEAGGVFARGFGASRPGRAWLCSGSGMLEKLWMGMSDFEQGKQNEGRPEG
jgi:hypothetical protein